MGCHECEFKFPMELEIAREEGLLPSPGTELLEPD
jgi:hypothetical protein